MPEKPTGARGARRGDQVLQRLRERPPTLWYHGEQIKDVTTHPALRGGVETLAELYDLQWRDPAVSLFESPSSGHKVGRSFLIPRTMEELRSVTAAMRVWQDHTHGLMGRAPDYINRAITGYAAGAAFLAEIEPALWRQRAALPPVPARTGSVPDAHADSAAGQSRGEHRKQTDPYMAARVKEETDAGIVIRGCRMLATLPISDEIMVFPSTLLKKRRGGCALRLWLLHSQ